jgi:hypothetical protein
MKTFKEFLSTTDWATNLTEATVKNDGTVGALLAILKQDPNIIRYLKYQTAKYGWKFNPELLALNEVTNRDILTTTKYKTIKTKAFDYELPIVNAGKFTLLYFGANSSDSTILTSESLDNVNFTITQRPETIISNSERGNTYATFYLEWGIVGGSALVLFDVTDEQVVSNLADENNQTVDGDPSKTTRYNRIKYKTAKVIPLSNTQNVVEKLVKAISDYVAKKTPAPEIKDVDIVMFFDGTKKVDTKKLVSKFSEFKTSNLVVGKSVFEITLLGVDLTLTNIDGIYNEINPSGGHIKLR